MKQVTATLNSRLCLTISLALLFMSITVLFGVSPARGAGCPPQEIQKIVHDHLGPFGTTYFGTAIAISGDVAVVGARADSGFHGAAYVYRWDGSNWVEEQRLAPPDTMWGDFGAAVDIEGNVIVVGDYNYDDLTYGCLGSASVFRWDGATWNLEQTLTPSPKVYTYYRRFGMSVSIAPSGDLIAIGSPEDTPTYPAMDNRGAVYLYRWNGSSWIQEDELGNPNPVGTGTLFGRDVAVSDSVLVAGEEAEDPMSGWWNGSVEVYRYDGVSWNFEQRITASDASVGDGFGESVDISDGADIIAVGDRLKGDDWPTFLIGEGYIYRFDGLAWNEEFQYQVPTPVGTKGSAGLGSAVALSGEMVLFGAAGYDGLYDDQGAAFLLEYDGANWSEVGTIFPSDPMTDGAFSLGLAFEGTDMAFGDRMYAWSPDTACVYFFSLPADTTDTDADGRPDACDNCVDDYNPSQTNSDADSLGDACDNCPDDYNPGQENADADSLGDACDNCPSDDNPLQEDGDNDTVGDICDNCPDNWNMSQTNSDADSLGDACDNCDFIDNPDQLNSDTDNLGDACDNCPYDDNPGQADSDADSLGDVCDNCPDRYNPGQEDFDNDGIGDVCDPVTYRDRKDRTPNMITP